MNDAGALLLATLLPLLLGWGLLRVVDARATSDGLAWSAWLLIASAVGTALLAGAWLALGGGSQRGVFVLVALVAGGLHLAAGRRRAAPLATPATPAASSTFSPAEHALFWTVIGGVLLAALASVAGAHARALVAGDDGAFWAPRARMLYTAADVRGASFEELVADVPLPPDYWAAFESRFALAGERGAELSGAPGAQLASGAPDLSGVTEQVAHLDYPLINPLLQWWCFVAAGELLDGANRLPMQLLSLALLLLLASGLRQLLRPWLAAAFLIVVFGLPQTRAALSTAYADGMTSAGLLLACDSLRRCRSLTRAQLGLLFSLGVTLMSGSKNEGLVYSLALVLGLALTQRARLRQLSAGLAVPALWWLGTWSFNRVHGLENDLLVDLSWRLERAPEILGFFWREIWSLPPRSLRPDALHTNGLLALALVSGLLCWPRERGTWRALMSVVLLLASFAHLGAYLCTPRGLDWQLATSALRVSSQLVPLAALVLAARFGRDRDETRA